MNRRRIGALCVTLFVVSAGGQEPTDHLSSPTDSVMTREGMRAIADLTRDDIGKLSRDDLVNLPFETLVMLAERLEVSIDELLKLRSTVASKKPVTIREQPGIVTVISGDDIRRSGARDLLDVLRMVPGIYFAMDVEGVVGIGMRGNWGHEGKVLLLIDGQVMNEKRYTGLSWDHHFPVDNIERVEIIRGPGSAMYGGYAELGVVNVVTKRGEDINGIEVNGLLGLLGKGEWTGGLTPTVARRDLSFTAGKRVGDFEFSTFGYYGSGRRSDELYATLYPRKDASGQIVINPDGSPAVISYDLSREKERGEIRSAHINAGLRYGSLSGRFLFDYSDAWAFTAEPYLNAFYATLGELRYDINLFDGRLKLTPRYNLSWEIPWYTPKWFGNLRVVRNTLGLTGLWEPAQWLTLTWGTEGHMDHVEFLDEPWDSSQGIPQNAEDLILFSGSREAELYNAAFFAEALWQIPAIRISLTTGGRYEYNDTYGHAFAPRIALTQVLQSFHWKFLYNRGFRPPSISNIEEQFGGNPIEPEKTDVFEIELGYRLTKHLFATANVFDITIRDPIVYWESDSAQGYFNGQRLGSRGIETEVALRYSRLSASVSYSYYTAADKPRSTEDMLYVVEKEGITNTYYAAPRHKATLCVNANPWRGLHLSASLLCLSRAYGNQELDTIHVPDSTGIPHVDVVTSPGRIDPAVLLNFFVAYENLLISGLTLGIGFYDLLDRSYPFAQAYNGWASPYPSYGREVAVRLTYTVRSRR